MQLANWFWVVNIGILIIYVYRYVLWFVHVLTTDEYWWLLFVYIMVGLVWICLGTMWGGKKTLRTFAWPFFCYRFFFLIVLQGIVITVTNIIDLVLQTIFCMTSLPNSITSNIIRRGRRQQSRRRQRCSRRQRQRQLRGSEVPRAGLGEEDSFC